MERNTDYNCVGFCDIKICQQGHGYDELTFLSWMAQQFHGTQNMRCSRPISFWPCSSNSPALLEGQLSNSSTVVYSREVSTQEALTTCGWSGLYPPEHWLQSSHNRTEVISAFNSAVEVVIKFSHSLCDEFLWFSDTNICGFQAG